MTKQILEGNDWADCIEIWHVLIAMLSTPVMGGVYLHVRTCAPLFHIFGTAGRIMLNFGEWLGIISYAF